MRNVRNALSEHFGPKMNDGWSHWRRLYKDWIPELQLTEAIRSYIRESQRPCTATPSTTLEFAPGCSVEVLDEEANVCVVRIALWVLPTLFHDVTGICEDPDYSMHEDDGIVRRVRVVYDPPKSSV